MCHHSPFACANSRTPKRQAFFRLPVAAVSPKFGRVHDTIRCRVLRRFQARGVTASQDPLEEVEEVDHPDSPNCGNPKSPVVHVDPTGPSLHPLPDSANSFKLPNPQCHQSSSPADCELKHVYKVGIPWTADEFVHEACLPGQKNYLGYMPDGLRECIESIASKTPSTRGANVAAELRKWVGRARALEVEEMDLKAKIPKHCKAILRKKRLCLFREMLVASGHEDISIVDDIKGGFAISGPRPAKDAFKPKRTSAVMTVGDLRGCASIVRKGIIDSTGPTGNDHLDASTMEATTKELERGWITGPTEPWGRGHTQIRHLAGIEVQAHRQLSRERGERDRKLD